MTLSPKSDLAIAFLAVYGPCLLLSIAVCIKQGFGRSMGWLYLVILCLLRLVGGATTLYINVKNDYSSGLVETATVTSAIGLAPLLMCSLAILERLNSYFFADKKSGEAMVFKVVYVVSMLGLIMSIVGGVKLGSGNGGNTDSTGKDFLEAGSVLFLVVYLAYAAVLAKTLTRRRAIPSQDAKLIAVAVAALPFLAVRMVYTLCIAFSDAGSVFYFQDVNVWVEAFMMFMPEVMVILLYVFAGLTTPKKLQQQFPLKPAQSPEMANSFN